MEHKFDHNNRDFQEACGYTDETTEALKQKLAKLSEQSENNSKLVENTAKELTPVELSYLLIDSLKKGARLMEKLEVLSFLHGLQGLSRPSVSEDAR